MHVLDSSAIAMLLKRLRGRSLGIFQTASTLDLARYELGNVIWKECMIEHAIGLEEAVNRAASLASVLRILRVDSVESIEDFLDAEKLAIDLNLTFYDASYLHIAKVKDSILVTEDKELRDKAEQIGIRAISSRELSDERAMP